ncbi:DUF2256 domain-containing protein [bacterium]|nr:DUF2256 domain-containing protein [bacterium]
MTHHKANLSVKDCSGCGRSFSWRKKWRLVWEHVKYCSERCRRSSKNSLGKNKS